MRLNRSRWLKDWATIGKFLLEHPAPHVFENYPDRRWQERYRWDDGGNNVEYSKYIIPPTMHNHDKD